MAITRHGINRQEVCCVFIFLCLLLLCLVNDFLTADNTNKFASLHDLFDERFLTVANVVWTCIGSWSLQIPFNVFLFFFRWARWCAARSRRPSTFWWRRPRTPRWTPCWVRGLSFTLKDWSFVFLSYLIGSAFGPYLAVDWWSSLYTKRLKFCPSYY